MQLIIRKASVRWVAGAHGGARAITTDSGALTDAPFTCAQMRGRNSMTNSAELIAAAHAGSFSLALANELGKAPLRAGEITVLAAVTLEHLTVGWTIMNIHLNVAAWLPGLSQGAFIDATMRAKSNCLVSRALRPTVSMNAKLETVSPHESGAKVIRKPPIRYRASRKGGRRPLSLVRAKLSKSRAA